jgi:heme iron utilization protein
MNGQEPESGQGKELSLEGMLASFKDLLFAVLATSDEGKPYTSLVAFALTSDRRTLIFATPKATRKYRNIVGQPAVSVLIDDRSQSADDLSDAQAVTLLGLARELKSAAEKEEYRKVFVSKHPELAAFAQASDTALIAVSIEQVVHVARFQEVSQWP